MTNLLFSDGICSHEKTRQDKTKTICQIVQTKSRLFGTVYWPVSNPIYSTLLLPQCSNSLYDYRHCCILGLQLFAFLFPPYTCPSFNSLLRVCQLKVFFNRSLPINVLSLEVPATFLHICSFLHFFYFLINLFKFKMVIIITEESGCRLIPVLNFISVVSSFFQGFKKKDSCPLEILY